MKKWIIIVAILICCGVYVIVKFSKPQGQNENNQAARTAGPGESGQVTSQNAATPTARPDNAQVEAVVGAFTEFQSCLKDQDYEQAWKLTSGNFRQIVCEGDFEKFKEVCDRIGLATATVHPKSAVVIDGRVGLLVTSPSFKEDLYFFFVEEDGQWRLHIGQEARDVPR